MTLEEALVTYGVPAAGAFASLVVAKHVAHEADRKANRAHDRMDEEEDKRHALEVRIAQVETRLTTVKEEVDNLRVKRHEGGNWLSGKLGLIEHEIDVLKDTLKER